MFNTSNGNESVSDTGTESEDGRVWSGAAGDDDGNEDMDKSQDDEDDEDDGVLEGVLQDDGDDGEDWRLFQEEGIHWTDEITVTTPRTVNRDDIEDQSKGDGGDN